MFFKLLQSTQDVKDWNENCQSILFEWSLIFWSILGVILGRDSKDSYMPHFVLQVFSVFYFTFSESWSHGKGGSSCGFRFVHVNYADSNWFRSAGRCAPLYSTFSLIFWATGSFLIMEYCLTMWNKWILEFNQVLQNDSCRLQQLQCHTSTPDHAFNRFFWGNLP